MIIYYGSQICCVQTVKTSAKESHKDLIVIRLSKIVSVNHLREQKGPVIIVIDWC
jgi:hypothetical protein